MNKGLFITFEGPEGSGKSTQSKRVHEHMTKTGVDAVWTREPGGTPVCAQIRQVLLSPDNAGMDDYTEVLLLAADRNEHIANMIKPAMDEGKVVVCDRFADSTLAYQGYGRGIPMEHLTYLHKLVTKGLAPDLTILVDVDVELGLSRVQTRGEVKGGDRIERQEIEFHQRLRKGYLELSSSYPDRYVVLDGSRTRDEIFNEIISVLKARFEVFRNL